MATTALNFYLPGLSTTTASVLNAEFYPVIETKNADVLDYSANAICRFPLEVAQNMFQFWASSSEISQNSLSSLAFRVWHDASSGAVDSGNEVNAQPMSLDFVNGAIVTWVDPSTQVNYINSSKTYKWTDSSGTTLQSLLPHDYLRYLAAKIFINSETDANGNTVITMNPDSEKILDNTEAVMNSVSTRSRIALEQKLDGLSASSISTRMYNYNHIKIQPSTMTPYTSNTGVGQENNVGASNNPAGIIFQQIRNKNINRINTYDSTAGLISTTSAPAGAWYKMPFIEQDSIYFTLGIRDPSGQILGSGIGVINEEIRKYRIRLYLLSQTSINGLSGGSGFNYTYGTMTPMTRVEDGYSWTGITEGNSRPNDEMPPSV